MFITHSPKCQIRYSALHMTNMLQKSGNKGSSLALVWCVGGGAHLCLHVHAHVYTRTHTFLFKLCIMIHLLHGLHTTLQGVIHTLYTASVPRALGGGLAILYIGAVMFSSPQLASIRMFKTVFSIILSTRLLNSGRL